MTLFARAPFDKRVLAPREERQQSQLSCDEEFEVNKSSCGWDLEQSLCFSAPSCTDADCEISWNKLMLWRENKGCRTKWSLSQTMFGQALSWHIPFKAEPWTSLALFPKSPRRDQKNFQSKMGRKKRKSENKKEQSWGRKSCSLTKRTTTHRNAKANDDIQHQLSTSAENTNIVQNSKLIGFWFIVRANIAFISHSLPSLKRHESYLQFSGIGNNLQRYVFPTYCLTFKKPR